MIRFSCFYCTEAASSFEDIVTHLILCHEKQEIKLKKNEKSISRTLNFRIIPEICKEQGRLITINYDKEKIHLSKSGECPKDSPLKKIIKLSNNSENSETFELLADESNYAENNEDEAKIIHDLLPTVIEELKRCGKLEEYIAFHRLVAVKKFPLSNIAFLLFLDVIRWFGLESSTSQMRYSKEVKLFWQTGLRLFHGRFLRFMSGPKNSEDILLGESNGGDCRPENSKVNFIVPNRKVLVEDTSFIPDKKPGIIHEMIENIVAHDSESLSYKLCVDGKKINPCSKGEVDLWGFEDRPTYMEKQSRLKEELDFVRFKIETLSHQIDLGHEDALSCTDVVQTELLTNCRILIQINSKRLSDLRKLQTKKEMFLKTLNEKCGSDWRKSNYAMVISSIRTSIFTIENTVASLLLCNDSLLSMAAALAGVSHLSETDNSVILEKQSNIVCLASDASIENPPLVKQRTDVWHALRKQSKITGSTINKALGFDGLKKQKLFWEEKNSKKEAEVPDYLKERFEYGTRNELNAVATLVSRYLPAFHPTTQFYEEGCYACSHDGEVDLIVSPDGSIRSCEEETVFGIEIKCPMPGKLYTTPIHYSIPHYYIPQILSEMHVLGVKELLFLSYSEESMSVLKAEFDEELWEEIFTQIKSVNSSNLPKRLGDYVSGMRLKIKAYCESKVELLVEIPSRKGVQCNHSPSGHTGRIHHDNQSLSTKNNIVSTGKLQKLFMEAEQSIDASHTMCVQKASEVLVFLISNMDRIHIQDLPHAFPIAFALKGYSMKSETMRCMLKQVLHVLFSKGLYVPVVSYDGQWAKLAFQSASGEALTLLELQKKVYAEVKNKKVSDLTRQIFNTGVTKIDNELDLYEKLTIEKMENGFSVSRRGNEKLFTMSSHIISLLKDCKTKKKKSEEVEKSDNNQINDVLTNVPPSILSELDDELIDNFSTYAECPLTTAVDESTDDTSAEMSPYSRFATSEDDSSDRVTESQDVQPTRDQTASNLVSTSSQGVRTGLNENNVLNILTKLKTNDQLSRKCGEMNATNLQELVQSSEKLGATVTKSELITFVEVLNKAQAELNIHVYKSWNKKRIACKIYEVLNCVEQTTQKSTRHKKSPPSLSLSCKKVIRSFPKSILNAVVAEHDFEERVLSWRRDSPFSTCTSVKDVEDVVWFSKPEYNEETMGYIFSILDVHHLITNCRIKVCKDGFPARGVQKAAWLKVATENKTNLKISHVEDLVDKQSDSIARLTFCEDVENEMIRLGYSNEAIFCRLIREFYEGEDEPGIDAKERCRRRLNLRNWLLKDVNFNAFPPYGSHIKGVPNVMFQGFLTNIERRIQVFPYIKSGAYNVRSMGSLEAENFFGEFQDLDPKGSGVVKAEEIPFVLETACQMNKTRLMPDRPFHLSLSRAKVYPVKELISECDMKFTQSLIYPIFVTEIIPRDHVFDSKTRAKRSAKRKLALIPNPEAAAHGVAPVRQHHKCDQSKILAHKRLGIELD